MLSVSAWFLNHRRFGDSLFKAAKVEIEMSVSEWDSVKGEYDELIPVTDSFEIVLLSDESILTVETRRFYRFTVKSVSNRNVYVSMNYTAGNKIPAETGVTNNPLDPRIVHAPEMLAFRGGPSAQPVIPSYQDIYSLPLTPLNFSAGGGNPFFNPAFPAGAEFLLSPGGMLQPDESIDFYLCFGFHLPGVLETLKIYSDVPTLTLVWAADIKAFCSGAQL